jgi:hypothetical protein
MKSIEGRNREAFVRFEDTIWITIAFVFHDFGRQLPAKQAGGRGSEDILQTKLELKMLFRKAVQ